MLSCEGNARERWKTTIGLISKKATLHEQHIFLYISLPLFCTTTTWNFHKLLSYTFYGGNVARVLAHFFFTAAHFHLALVAASISYFLTAATKLSCSSCNRKKCLFCCLSPALDLCRHFFSLSFAGMPPTSSFSLSFSCSIFQFFGNDNSIQSKLLGSD